MSPVVKFKSNSPINDCVNHRCHINNSHTDSFLPENTSTNSTGMYRDFFCVESTAPPKEDSTSLRIVNSIESNKEVFENTSLPAPTASTTNNQKSSRSAERNSDERPVEISKHIPTVIFQILGESSSFESKLPLKESIKMINAPIQIHVPQLNTNAEQFPSSKLREAVNGNTDFLEELQRRHDENQRNKSDSSSSRPSRTKSNSSSDADRRKRLTMPLIYRMYESQSEDLRGTIRYPDDDGFHPEAGSQALRNALSGGIQSDDKVIIEVLLSHNNFQRQKIVAAYEGMYNRRLSDDIEEEAGGFFLDAVLALIQPAHVYSARLLYFAISGRTHSRSIAVEIALTSTAPQLKVIRDAYQTEFRITLEKDLNVKVEGLFGKMLHQILLRNKNFDSEVDIEMAERQVEWLLSQAENGIEEIGRNLDSFNRIFGNQGLNQVRTFLERYDARMVGSNESDVRGRDFESLVRKSINIHSDVRQMMLLYIRISRNMQLYFAEKLFESISGSRPDHSSIIRILVTRSEIDLYDICEEYKRKYGHHIVYDLQRTCSGDFLRLLYQLVNPLDFGSGLNGTGNDEVFTEE